jgi:hypothetical protein
MGRLRTRTRGERRLGCKPRSALWNLIILYNRRIKFRAKPPSHFRLFSGNTQKYKDKLFGWRFALR